MVMMKSMCVCVCGVRWCVYGVCMVWGGANLDSFGVFECDMVPPGHYFYHTNTMEYACCLRIRQHTN